MTGVGPEGENVRKAVQWISDKRQYEGGGPLATLIEEASGKRVITTPANISKPGLSQHSGIFDWFGFLLLY